MGLSPPTVKEVSPKLHWFKSWFDEVSVDRGYTAVGSTLVERRLTARDIEPYFELLGLTELMDYEQFFSIIRTLDRAWMTALQRYKAERVSKTAGKPS